jgi:glycerol-3-phosphate acyltransferase PlsX
VLKLAESVFDLSQKLHITNPFFQQYNYENFGGIPIIGVGSPVLIGHGKSTPLAIKNMLIKNQELVQSGLIKKLKEAFE